MDEKEKKYLNNLWPVLCLWICSSGGMIFKSRVWERNSVTLLSFITVVGLAVLGAVIGLITFKLGKKAKITSLVICLLIFTSMITASSYLTSDRYIVKKEWPVHELDKITFAYPSVLKEKNLKGQLPDNADVKVLTNENMNRYVACYTYDFTRDKPTLESCVGNAVTAMLTRYGSKTLVWDKDTTEVSPTLVKGRFTYTNKLRNKTLSHTGFAFGYAEGSHYEIVMFLPLREQFSDDFMKKIEESIKLRVES